MNETNKKVIVASFSNVGGAKSGLDRLRAGGARLGNAALIQRLPDGRVEFTETQDWGIGKSAAIGALGALLLPGIGIFGGGVIGGLAAYLIDAGFPDALLRQMGSGISPGTSLLIALVEEGDTALAERVLTESGASVLGSGLEADLSAAMKRIGST